MSACLPDPASTPWQPRSLRGPSWPPTSPAHDVHSTSTVTDDSAASASSASSRSSRDGVDVDVNDLSPRSSPTPHTVWVPDEFDDDYELASPFSRKAASVASRALPRCAVVNFRREGDNLRWAPRVTQNASGVAARVHNFEDAFSLEEFSSRALPVVWQGRGGNPRLSSAVREEEADQAQGNMDKTPRSKSSMSSSQKSLMKSPSIKRTMALAQEIRRPSFWSLLAHNNRIQKNRAQRLAHDDRPVEEKTDVMPRKGAWSAIIKAVMKRGAGAQEKGKKTASLFRRFVERRGTKAEKGLFQEEERPEDRDSSRLAPNREEKLGTIRLRRKNGARMSADVSGLGDGGRRVRSSLTGVSKKKAEENAPATSQDDQYVTFITSALC